MSPGSVIGPRVGRSPTRKESPLSLFSVGLPIADRARSFAFYQDGLQLPSTGDIAEDGMPEPMQFMVNDHATVVLVPADGFAWVLSGRHLADPASSECVLNLPTATAADVDTVV